MKQVLKRFLSYVRLINSSDVESKKLPEHHGSERPCRNVVP